MEGEQFPMNINEQIVRPLLSEHQRDRAVLHPHDYDALVCRREAAAAIPSELLATSPIKDYEVIIGKCGWLRCSCTHSCCCPRQSSTLSSCSGTAIPIGKPLAIGYLGLLLVVSRGIAGHWDHLFPSLTQKSNYRWCCVTFGVCLMLWVLITVGSRQYDNSTWAQVLSYMCG